VKSAMIHQGGRIFDGFGREVGPDAAAVDVLEAVLIHNKLEQQPTTTSP